MTVQLGKASFARTAWVVVFAMSLVLAMAAQPPVGAQEEDEPPSDEPAFVHPDLQEQVAEADAGDGSMMAVAVVEGSADVSAVAGDSRAVASELQDFADSAQAEVVDQIAGLDTGAIRVVNQLWILNAMVVELSPTEDTLNELATIAGVERVVPNYEFSVGEPEEAEPVTVDDRTYGIDVIEAHQVWDQLGIEGDGVRVATLDTGVDIDHPDLDGKMVTDDPDDPTYPGGWMEFGPGGNLVESEPHDSSDHGTHVAGTIHGEDNHPDGVSIGVAPASDMMHGLVIPGGEGDFDQVAAGMQWAMDPTDADGEPAGEPADVVNMSLGLNDYIADMIEPTQNMRAAGIFPAFSSGNTDLFGDCRPGEGNVGSGSPANVYEAVAVGATDVNDDVADFSCGEWIDTFDDGYWGNDAPEEWPDEYVVPNVSAPGVDTLSALPDGNWGNFSGTSMAAPHVAGTVALMLSASPGESVDFVQETLEDTSFWDDRHYDERPDRRYGHGRINAFDAVQEVAIDSGIEGTVSGPDGPIEDATVIAGDRTATTDEEGEYQLRLEPGEYEVTAEAFGFDSETEDVTVSEAEFTSQDFTLDPAATGSIEGQVTDVDSEAGIEDAEISVADAPLSAETDADGNYTISDAPEGEWTVNATADGYYDAEPQQITVVEGDSATADFALEELPPAIGIAGDNGTQIADFLDDYGLLHEPFTENDSAADFAIVVWNDFTDPGSDEFSDFLSDAAEAETGLLFLDTWSAGVNGIDLLHTHLENPAQQETGFGDGELSYEVTAEHPLVEGFEIGQEIEFDVSSGDFDYAWFDGFESDEWGDVTNVADAAAGGDSLGGGIAARDSDDGDRHALLSLHGASTFAGPQYWEPGGVTIFLNAIDWLSDEIEVEDPILEALEVEPASADMDPGEELQLTATAVYSNFPDADVTDEASWESDDPDVAAVSDEGLVTAGEVGTETGEATVTATFEDEDGNEEQDTSDITVHPRPSSLTVDPDEFTVEHDEPGETTHDLTIGNEGDLPLDWEIDAAEAGADGAADTARTVVGDATLPGTVESGGGEPAAGFAVGSDEADGEPQTATYDGPVAQDDTVLTHSESMDIEEVNSAACWNSGQQTTSENSYLRTFTLEDFDIHNDFDVSEVTFGIETQTGDWEWDVVLHQLETGEELLWENLNEIGSASVDVEEQELGLVTVDVEGTVEAGATLVVELTHEATDGNPGLYMFVGSNSQGESAPSYISADECGMPEPEPTSEIDFPEMHLVMEVAGSGMAAACVDPTDAEWLDVDPASGQTDGGAEDEVEVTIDTAGLDDGLIQGVLCITSDGGDQQVPVNVLLGDGPFIVDLDVDPESAEIEGIGEAVELTATEIHFDGEENDVTEDATWESDDPDVATVADDGTVTATGDGEATITAEHEGFEGTSEITVVAHGAELTVDPEEFDVEVEDGETTEETLTIGNDGDQDLEWEIFTAEAVEASSSVSGEASVVSGASAPESATIGDVELSTQELDGAEPQRFSQEFEPSEDQVTITHSESQDIVEVNSAACGSLEGTSENSYLRTFTLEDFDIDGEFDVTEVEFGVETHTGPEVTGEVIVHQLDPGDDFLFENLEQLGSAEVDLDASLTGQIVTVPVDSDGPVEAGTTVVVEVLVPPVDELFGGFYIGSNPDGQTAPSYIASEDCDLDEPSDTAEIDFPDMHIVMNVTGDTASAACADPADIGWLSADPDEGTTEAGDSDDVAVTVDATDLGVGDHAAVLCVSSDSANNDLLEVPVSATVTEADDPAPELESVEVEPQSAELAPEEMQQFTATAHFDDDTSEDVTDEAEWASSDDDIVVVDDEDESGLATAVAEGTADVSAEFDGEWDSASVTVSEDPPVDPVELEVLPESAELAPGDTEQFTAWATYEDEDDPVDVTDDAEWSSDDTDVVTVDDVGLATAEAVGEADVTAEFGGLSDSGSVTVSEDDVPPPEDPVDLVVEPSETTVGVGGVAQFEATAVYEDDTEVTMTDEAEWVSEDTDVATVDDAGLVTGVAEGDTEVTATFEGLSDSASVTVDGEIEPGPEGLVRISAEPGRVEVAIAASEHRFDDGEASAVVLARADEYPDALAGTTLAAEHDAPLLLTSSDELLGNVAEEVSRVLGDDGLVYLTGGTAALDDTVEGAVDELGYQTMRLGGETRFETAGLIAEELGERSQVLVTTGLDFPDALTAGAAASANDGVVLLSADEDPHDVVDDYLEGFDGEVTAVGGPATRAYPDAEAVMGETRDETAVAVAEAFFDEPVAFGIARRDDYPDALAGGAHIAAYEGPLLLTYTEDVPEETAEWLSDTDATGGFVYGGTAAVDEDTFDELEDLTFGDNDNDDDDNDEE